MNETDVNPVDNLIELLRKHALWLTGTDRGERADLRGAYLSRAYLSKANLSGAYLSGAYLSRADLSKANLSMADLSGADLSEAKLSEANLTGANLSRADLSRAKLSETYLSKADLSMADLSGADLSKANLSGANLSMADLSGADLSGATGLLDAITWLEQHLERDPRGRGYVAYKTFGAYQTPPESWKLEPGSILTEVVLPDRCCDCACGINVSTREWISKTLEYQSKDIWQVLIRWEWLPGVVVPLHTDGKIRCSRVELLEIIERAMTNAD